MPGNKATLSARLDDNDHEREKALYCPWKGYVNSLGVRTDPGD